MNTDQKALDRASEIMQLLDKPIPYGQLKAKIQCIIIDVLSETNSELELAKVQLKACREKIYKVRDALE